MKKQLIKELVEDEISSEESARVEVEVDLAKRQLDLARERERERIQMEMYDDPYMNWSGHR